MPRLLDVPLAGPDSLVLCRARRPGHEQALKGPLVAHKHTGLHSWRMLKLSCKQSILLDCPCMEHRRTILCWGSPGYEVVCVVIALGLGV